MLAGHHSNRNPNLWIITSILIALGAQSSYCFLSEDPSTDPPSSTSATTTTIVVEATEIPSLPPPPQTPISLFASNYAAVGVVVDDDGRTSNFGSPRAKVKLDVYYETLCPDSIAFMVNKVIPEYPLFKHFVDLHLYPFGKAEV